MIEKIKYRIKFFLNYYNSFVPFYGLKNKKIINRGEYVSFGKEELQCLKKAKEIFGPIQDFVNGFVQKETFLVNFKNVVFLGNSGAIVENGRIIAESLGDYYKLSKSESFRKIKILKSIKERGTFSSILDYKLGHNFYHWTVDCLPRMYNIKQIPTDEPITILINEDIKPYQLEVLHFFLNRDPRLRLKKIKKNEKQHVENFWLPSFVTTSGSGYMPREYVDYIKETILLGYEISSPFTNRKIYLSRKGQKRRKFLNEQDLENFLLLKGFDIIYPEKLKYEEQVKLFSSASFILSPHGAGLTNIIFATNATVIELHPSNYVPAHYCLLSKACGHSYHCFLGNEADSLYNWDINLAAFKSWYKSFE